MGYSGNKLIAILSRWFHIILLASWEKIYFLLAEWRSHAACDRRDSYTIHCNLNPLNGCNFRFVAYLWILRPFLYVIAIFFVSSLMCFIGLVDVHRLKRQKDVKFCAMCLMSWMAAATTEKRQVRWSVSWKALEVQKISINQSRKLTLSR